MSTVDLAWVQFQFVMTIGSAWFHILTAAVHLRNLQHEQANICCRCRGTATFSRRSTSKCCKTAIVPTLHLRSSCSTVEAPNEAVLVLNAVQVGECALSMLAALAEEMFNMDQRQRGALVEATDSSWHQLVQMMQGLVPQHMQAGEGPACVTRGSSTGKHPPC